MKKIMLIGKSGAGKTTLLQRLNDYPIEYKKTQSVEVSGNVIDTPGEYMENKRMFHALIVTGVEAKLVLLLQDATDDESSFFVGMNGILPMPIIGVVSKIDLASEKEIERAHNFLELAGARTIVDISAVADTGIDELRNAIDEALADAED